MSERLTLFVDVILPLAVPKLYTYRVPTELNESICSGQRVVVQFGKNKLYTAIVRTIHQTAPGQYTAKYIEGILDDVPLVLPHQFKLWEWMASYYCCTIGEVLLAALPGSLRLGSESKIVINGNFNFETPLHEKEQVVMDALVVREVLTLAEISELLSIKTVQPLIKSLLDKGAIEVEEELKYKYRPKLKSVIELAENYQSELQLKELIDALEQDKRATKQLDALLKYLQLSHAHSDKKLLVAKSDLVKAVEGSGSAIETLIRKKIFISKAIRVDRLAIDEISTSLPYNLSPEQTICLNEIKQQLEEKNSVLLHGVTGSGKTEIYIHLIQSLLENNEGQVLYLLPEIALTAQIINRLRKFFGDKVGIYHSKFNENERAEIWSKTLRGEYKIVLGARSSLFLPFRNLKLIIIDEEHENSFKQFDPAPRYNARDSALYLATLYSAKVVLGSATPSIESYYNAKEGKYGFVRLDKRFSGILLPEIQCIDIKKAQKNKEMHESFSHELIEHIKYAISQEEQVILFQNRRGYTPQWACETCGWIPRCKNCDVSLTYHKFVDQLVCHYCSSSYPPPTTCSACGSNKLKMVGFGTEKIEEDLAKFVPGIRIARMDLDTTRNKNSYLNLINDFEDRQIDVLVGTQMVSKGLDFDNVSTVGVLNADAMLNFPDFRAFERSYQLLTQVAGRSGRKNKRGRVFIQTYNPNHWVIQKVMETDYIGLYNQEILERKNYHYPPFVRLIRLTLRHRDKYVNQQGADLLALELKKEFKGRVLGPEEPIIARIRNYYYRTILLKFERGSNYVEFKEMMQLKIQELNRHPDFKRLFVDIDVDPM